MSNIISHQEPPNTCALLLLLLFKLGTWELDCYKLVDAQAVNIESSK